MRESRSRPMLGLRAEEGPAASLTLVVSDVLKWNYPLTRRQQGILAIALRDAACQRVETTEQEREWFAAFLDADLRVTAYADEHALTTEAAPKPLTPKCICMPDYDCPVHGHDASGVVCRPTEGET